MEYMADVKYRAICYNCGGEIVFIEWEDDLPASWCHEADWSVPCPTNRVAVPKQETIVDA